MEHTQELYRELIDMIYDFGVKICPTASAETGMVRRVVRKLDGSQWEIHYSGEDEENIIKMVRVYADGTELEVKIGNDPIAMVDTVEK